jgi:hypothetical protein
MLENQEQRKYTREELVSFVNGIITASASMRGLMSVISNNAVECQKSTESPYYIVNLHGSLPLFDILCIADPSVDVDRAVYFPGSSRIQNSREVLRKCFYNFLIEKQDETSSITPLFSIDEIVGGHSVERVINAYNSALNGVARKNLEGTERRAADIQEVAYDLKHQFPLHIFGVKDTRNLGRKMNQRYLHFSSETNSNRMVFEFPVKKIITMDDPDYETLEFSHPTSSGWTPDNGYYPKIEALFFKRAYMDLLHDVARLIGSDPEMVNPSRARVITHCERYSRNPNNR